MITCTKCNKNQNESNFNFKNKKLGLKQSQCKDCTRTNTRKHYQNNKSYYKTRNKKQRGLYSAEVNSYVLAYLKAHSCIDCGETDPIVLDFDHIKDKILAISTMIGRMYPLDKIKLEITKCEIRCANCHRRKTYKQMNYKCKS